VSGCGRGGVEEGWAFAGHAILPVLRQVSAHGGHRTAVPAIVPGGVRGPWQAEQIFRLFFSASRASAARKCSRSAVTRRLHSPTILATLAASRPAGGVCGCPPAMWAAATASSPGMRSCWSLAALEPVEDHVIREPHPYDSGTRCRNLTGLDAVPGIDQPGDATVIADREP
jgi:hypothetical protein